MKSARTATHILIFVSLLLIGSLIWTGCGGSSASTSTSSANAMLTGSTPFVAFAVPADSTDGGMGQIGDVTQTRNATVSYLVDATDPRLSGTFAVVYNMDEATDGTLIKFYGTWKLTNDQGTWVCDSWRGASDGGRGHYFTVGRGKGTGAYEGLVSVWQWYWSQNPTTGLPDAAVSGWIEKAK